MAVLWNGDDEILWQNLVLRYILISHKVYDISRMIIYPLKMNKSIIQPIFGNKGTDEVQNNTRYYWPNLTPPHSKFPHIYIALAFQEKNVLGYHFSSCCQATQTTST